MGAWRLMMVKLCYLAKSTKSQKCAFLITLIATHVATVFFTFFMAAANNAQYCTVFPQPHNLLKGSVALP